MAETFRVVLPYRGEFGHKVMWHAGFVAAVSKPKIVYCEPGEECLYPDADRWEIVDSQPEQHRLEWTEYDEGFTHLIRNIATIEFGPNAILVEPLPRHPETYDDLKQFVPQPHVKQGITCDVVVCPRKRSGKDQLAKNWPHWAELVDYLTPRYQVFAAGSPDSSAEVDCPRAWDHDRFLDATVEAMLSAKVVVATDSGLAHLAVLCGRPLIVITHGNRSTAPGYRTVNMDRYTRANHCESPIEFCSNTWDRLDLLVDAVCVAAGEIDERYGYWVTRHANLSLTPPSSTVRTDWIIDELEGRLPDHCSKILDFGCGDGRLGPFLADWCDCYYGADIVPRALLHAREIFDSAVSNPAKASFELIRDGVIPFAQTRFDAVLSITVLQHVLSDELMHGYMRQWFERMTDGGFLLLYENVAQRADASHIRFRSLPIYVDALTRAGFAVQTIGLNEDNFRCTDIRWVERVRELAADPEHELHAFIEARKVPQ